ncbi:MAG: UTP--glucose-1-phosphate uridylyltransferase GalU [Rickettsiales bacterium]|nr:UTP--glucose-1-phosphate uridylyltransferase GalU [Rickettsiales bacterium]
MSTKIRRAVFPVGGLGTRFLPATKSMPKEMLPIVDKPLIHHAFEEAVAAGIEQFIFVTGRNKNAISNHFDHSYELQRILTDKNKERELSLTREWLPDAGNIIFTRQMEPLGLGHAVWCARHWIGDEPFAVILADDMVLSDTPCLKQMVDAYEKGPGNMAAVMNVPKGQTNKYGILDIAEDDGQIVKAKGVVEKPAPADAPSDLSIIGRYILQPDIFEQLESQAKGAGGEIQLTDAMNDQIGTVDFYGFRFEGTRFDCGERAGYIEANVAYALEEDGLRERVLERLGPYFSADAKKGAA